MKWGLFFISIGALAICLAGDPTSAMDYTFIVSGLLIIVFGFAFIAFSKKLEKRKLAREEVEREAEEFEAEQVRKKAEASLQKQRDNVEKSRQKSMENKNSK